MMMITMMMMRERERCKGGPGLENERDSPSYDMHVLGTWRWIFHSEVLDAI